MRTINHFRFYFLFLAVLGGQAYANPSFLTFLQKPMTHFQIFCVNYLLGSVAVSQQTARHVQEIQGAEVNQNIANSAKKLLAASLTIPLVASGLATGYTTGFEKIFKKPLPASNLGSMAFKVGANKIFFGGLLGGLYLKSIYEDILRPVPQVEIKK